MSHPDARPGPAGLLWKTVVHGCLVASMLSLVACGSGSGGSSGGDDGGTTPIDGGGDDGGGIDGGGGDDDGGNDDGGGDDGTNQPPIADAGPDIIVSDTDMDGIEKVRIQGHGSVDPDGTIETYAWSDGAGQTGSSPLSTFRLPPGIHTITLTVTDDDGASATDSMILRVTDPSANTAPTAVISVDAAEVTDSNNTGGETLSFDASNSLDAEDNITAYEWSVAGMQVADAAMADVTLSVGTHDVVLTVTDSDGLSDSSSLSVTVHPGSGDDGPTGTVEERIAAGMQLWRKDDKKFGVGCWACHGPDFFDLAFVDFRPQEDIIHRGLVHLEESEMEVMLDGIEAMREKYAIDPVDRMQFRPFQPGGEVLPGANAGEQEESFANELAKHDLLLTQGIVSSAEDARIMRDELLGRRPLGSAEAPPEVYSPDADQELQHFNFRSVKVGIALNRWSEDHRFGVEHNTVADWITDHPQMPKSEESKQALFAVADAYLADPSEKTLADYIMALAEHTEPFDVEAHFAGTDNSGHFMRDKFMGAQFAIHIMRMNTLHGHDHFLELPAPAMHPYNVDFDRNGKALNEIWDVGSKMRSGLSNITFGSLVNQAPSNDTLEMRSLNIVTAWFWNGFYIDPGTKRTGASNSTKSAEYLHQHARRRGYFLHTTFMNAVHSAFSSYGEHSYDMNIGKPASYDLRDSHIDVRFPYWDQTSSGYWEHVEEGRTKAAAMMQRLAKNMFRSYLYWMRDDLLHRMPFNNMDAERRAEMMEKWKDRARPYHAGLHGTDGKDRRYFGPLLDGDDHDDDALLQEVLDLIDDSASPG